MRCVIMLNCIACCLAAHMWHRVGLLTDDDYARVAHKVVAPPAGDGRRRYMPGCFLGFAYGMRSLARPNCDDEPLKVGGAGVSDTAAFGYRTEWKGQLCREYNDILRDYRKLAYTEDSFEKRRGESVVNLDFFIKKHTEELKQKFASSERLRKSYAYLRSLTQVFDLNYAEFSRIMIAFNSLSKRISDFVNDFQVTNLEGLDAATIENLDTIRESLDARCLNHNCGKYFYYSIPAPVLTVAHIPEVIDDDLIDRLDGYCRKMLECVCEFPEDISRTISDYIMRCNGGKDPYEHLHLVYPELDYEAWEHFWQAAQKQVTVQLEALQRHVDDVQRCRSGQKLESYLKYLIKIMDSTNKDLGVIYRGRAVSCDIIECATAAVAENIAALSFEEIDKLIAIDAEAADEGMLDSTSSVRSDFKFTSITDIGTSRAPVPSPESIREDTPASAEGAPQHSHAGGTAQPGWLLLKIEQLERACKTMADPQAQRNRRCLQRQTGGRDNTASEAPERMED
ncbi:hypothetical protein PAPHI01_1967 [Pancytospora philotis]|nr:hypothetical protein PAPHI01_1967 [Pancytospora philotis]